MENKERLKITENLFSGNEYTVLKALSLIKEKGDAEILKSVILLFHSSSNEKINTEIKDILCTLKSKSVGLVLSESLQNADYSNIRKDLLIGCWMSGVIFENSLSVFVDIFLKEDFLTAFEAFTVIENCVSLENNKEIEVEILKLKTFSSEISVEKKQIIDKLIDFLEK